MGGLSQINGLRCRDFWLRCSAGTPRRRIRWRYWSRPLAWIGLGNLVAASPMPLCGSLRQPGRGFGSSFSSVYSWYRLLPNPTFAPGILLGVFHTRSCAGHGGNIDPDCPLASAAGMLGVCW
jgi:hypothetical protein